MILMTVRVVRLVLEAHRVAHRVGDLCPDLPGDELRYGDRGDAPGLRDADDPASGVARLVEDERDLRGLAGAGRALHHDDLVVCEGGQYLFPLLVDGKLVGVHVVDSL